MYLLLQLHGHSVFENGSMNAFSLAIWPHVFHAHVYDAIRCFERDHTLYCIAQAVGNEALCHLLVVLLYTEQNLFVTLVFGKKVSVEHVNYLVCIFIYFSWQCIIAFQIRLSHHYGEQSVNCSCNERYPQQNHYCFNMPLNGLPST